MKPITFCIASAKNERDYTKLLLRSLQDHTQLDLHEVLIFIDSDNQNTYEMLVSLKKTIPNLRIYRNTTGRPVGSQRNVSIMFEAASHDIVCYLQSDMVVGVDFDNHIINSIDINTILSCARIEPPLHPASPEKIVKDFGIYPEEFKYDEFKEYVLELQKEDRPNMIGHFAPFAVYRSTWFDKLGGFDTQFRCSREDSDTIIRMEMVGLQTIQSWNACVYHFTCVSSRGKDWFKNDEEAHYKNELQQQADQQELKRFIRKWGYFGHHPKPVYDIAFVVDLDRYADMQLLKYIEPYCKRLYLSDLSIAQQLTSQVEFESHYYANLRWGYSTDHWNSVKSYFNPVKFSERIIACEDKPAGDVVVSVKYSELLKEINNQDTRTLIENMQEWVDQNDVGVYEGGPFTIHIKQKIDYSKNLAKIDNTNLLLNSQKFPFE
jgi:GT2 family glycosyltransferase